MKSSNTEDMRNMAVKLDALASRILAITEQPLFLEMGVALGEIRSSSIELDRMIAHLLYERPDDQNLIKMSVKVRSILNLINDVEAAVRRFNDDLNAIESG